MNTNSTVVQVLRWSSAVLLCGVALWSFNLTAYNIWAAGFPDSPSQAYMHRAWLFFGVSLVSCIAAGVVIWRLRRRKT